MWVDIYSERGNQRKMLALGIGEAPRKATSSHMGVSFLENPQKTVVTFLLGSLQHHKKRGQGHIHVFDLKHVCWAIQHGGLANPGNIRRWLDGWTAGWLDGWMAGWLANRPKSCTHWTTSCLFVFVLLFFK